MTCDYDGLTYMVDRELLGRLGRVSVDFVERGWRTGFVIASEKPLGLNLGSCGGSCEC